MMKEKIIELPPERDKPITGKWNIDAIFKIKRFFGAGIKEEELLSGKIIPIKDTKLTLKYDTGEHAIGVFQKGKAVPIITMWLDNRDNVIKIKSLEERAMSHPATSGKKGKIAIKGGMSEFFHSNRKAINTMKALVKDGVLDRGAPQLAELAIQKQKKPLPY
jgi:hypothetical protein